MIISGISLSLIPAMAQFNTVSSASDHYREESVQAATKDKETASDNTGSGKGVSENTGKSGARGDVQRQMVVERYPLPASVNFMGESICRHMATRCWR